MFYRGKFDKIINEILTEAGLTTTEQKFANWPAGATRELVKINKQLGTKPKNAAFIGFARTLKDHPDKFTLRAETLLNAALIVALRHDDLDYGVIDLLQNEIGKLKV